MRDPYVRIYLYININYYCILSINDNKTLPIHLFIVIPKKIPKRIPESANSIHSAARVNHTQHRQTACFAPSAQPLIVYSIMHNIIDSFMHDVAILKLPIITKIVATHMWFKVPQSQDI